MKCGNCDVASVLECFDRTEKLEEQHLFKIKIFCNILNVIIDQWNASLLNKSVHLKKIFFLNGIHLETSLGIVT